MIPERDIDHVGQGLGLMISQYRGRPRLAGWLRAYLNQCQLLEDAIYDVLIKRLIQNAEGVQCDVIGRIVGELRQGLNDATYKIFIAARVRINRSRGNVTDVLDVYRMITATTTIFNEYRPAGLFFELLTIPDHDPVLLYTLLHDTRAAGVLLSMISPTTDTEAFRPLNIGDANSPTHAVGDASDTSATITSTNAGPYVLADGMTLTGTVDGLAFTFTFHTADFVAIGAATVAEVITVLNRERRRRMTASGSTHVTLTTYRRGRRDRRRPRRTATPS